MSSYPKVAVVILNWNGRFFLEKYLPSVFNSKYPNIEFIVGDNASTDDSVDFVRENYPVIRIIRNADNYGFAGGYNKVLEQVDADYFILLNSDVEVTPDWIEPIIELFENDATVAVAQPKILSFHDKNSFEHAGAAGGFIDSYGYPFCRGRIFDHVEKDNGQYDDNLEVFWASGAAFFIRSSIWKEVAGFDADFFAHMEEIDLCWRVKKLGHRIMVCPQSTVYHVGGGTLNSSNPQKTYLNFRNNLVMLQKNLSFWRAVYVIGIRLWLDFFALIKFLADGKRKDAWAVSRSHQYFFLHLFRNAKKRVSHVKQENKIGLFKRSIVWLYFVQKVDQFSLLKKDDFHSKNKK